MKFTIEGFSQAELMSRGLDLTDAVLLRWFVDFKESGKMKRITKDGEVYHWVQYQAVIDDIPCSGITNKESLGRRFQKLVRAKVLKLFIFSVGGRFSYFAIDPDGFAPLIDSHSTQKSLALDSKVVCHPTQKSGLIDSSTIDPSTKYKYPQDSQPLILATLLMTEHRKTDDKFLVGKERDTLQRWADDIEKLIRLDQRTPEEIRRVIVWCQSPGCFWVPNVLSGSKLRQKFPNLISQAVKTVTQQPSDAWRIIDPLDAELDALERQNSGS